MTTKAQATERDEAIGRLREWIAPGDELRTILRHVSASGMLRVVDMVKLQPSERRPGDVDVLAVAWNAAKAMGDRFDRDREGIRVSGCGMDMGFHLVYNLGRTLFPDGFDCVGDRCPSNDHSNGDRDYSPHRHSDGGYALRQRWM